MINLSAVQLSAMTGARIDRATANLQALVRAMGMFKIDTTQRIAQFCAQIGHESGGLRYSAEIWGPTTQQKRYERNFSAPWPSTSVEAKTPEFQVNRLAFGLGNAAIGDGVRYKGRGWMQVTGHYNYSVVRPQLAMMLSGVDIPDFEAEPQKLEEPLWSAMSACNFWHRNGLNRFADTNDFDGVSDTINIGRKTQTVGDANGYKERYALWQAGRKVLV